MRFLQNIYNWSLKNYFKVIVIFSLIALSYGIYFYFSFTALKKDQDMGNYFSGFYNTFADSGFDKEEYQIILNKINEIKDNSIYTIMLQSIYASELIKENNIGDGLEQLLAAKELVSKKNNEFNFLKEIIKLRIAKVYIELQDFDRAKKILESEFSTYKTNHLILRGDILAIEKKSNEAKNIYNEALISSENTTQRNLINLKISNLIN